MVVGPLPYTPWLCSIAMLALACGSGPRVLLPAHGNDPPEIQQACNRAEVRCSSCHTLDRIVGYSHHGRADWEQEVARMRLKPASGISPTDAELIVACLVYIDANRATAGVGWEPPVAPGRQLRCALADLR